jgi:poly(A) polymerase
MNFSITNMEEAKYLYKIFSIEDIEIRIVGGFVRDMILNRATTDIDLVANCQPDIITKILQNNNIKYRSTHIDHGVVIAIVRGKAFEISSLREDVECYGRKAKVSFITDFAIDAQRRDFTINALYLDFSGKIYDFFSSKEDIKNGVIAFIGDPSCRINEDYLRILRFFRFLSFYGKTIDEPALQSIKKLQHHLKKISAERINKEFFKTLLCPRKIWLLGILQNIEQCGIFQTLFSIKRVNIFYLKRLFVAERFLSHNFLYQEIIYLLTLIFNEKEEKIQQIFNNLKISNKQQIYLKNILCFNKNIPKEFTFKNIIELAINLRLENKALIADFLLLINVKQRKNFNIKILFEQLVNFNFPCIKITEINKDIFQGKEIGREIKRRKIEKLAEISCF